MPSITRKRRLHKKSRLGCRNCKIRRVKCDETRPQCRQCRSFQVTCNYDNEGFDLQASHDAVTDLRDSISNNQAALSIINRTFDSTPRGYRLELDDLERLGRFQNRTILTMGTDRSVPVYQKEVVRLACSHPFVMHAVITLVVKHDRAISDSPFGEPTTFEIYHEYQATALLNEKLSKPLLPDERDAVGAVGGLLGAWTLASIEAPTPEKAWPLKAESREDLQWLKLSEGKRELWKIADPLRPESCFRSFFTEYLEQSNVAEQTELAVDKLPPEFSDLFNLQVISNPANNPYYKAVQIIALLQDIDCNHSNCLRFFSFTSDIQPSYYALLQQKDPRALLLMAYWYAKVCHYEWWIGRRATMECKAICIHLERYHSKETVILDLLSYPKKRCGLDSHTPIHSHEEVSLSTCSAIAASSSPANRRSKSSNSRPLLSGKNR